MFKSFEFFIFPHFIITFTIFFFNNSLIFYFNLLILLCYFLYFLLEFPRVTSAEVHKLKYTITHKFWAPFNNLILFLF